MGEAAAAIYGDPSHDVTFIGVTGTNGKTTTSYFIDNALAQVHPHRGIFGTVELRIGDEAIESPRTTVESPVLHGFLARMIEEGVTAAVSEVSSHAAALDRIAGVQFAVAVFTNLQWDHLDFHKTMDKYLADKAKLFAPGTSPARRGVHRRRVRAAPRARGTDSCRDGVHPPGSPRGDWNVEDADVGLDGVGSRFTLVAPDGVAPRRRKPAAWPRQRLQRGGGDRGGPRGRRAARRRDPRRGDGA